VQAAHPAARVEVWSADQHRIGLRPIVRRVWYRRGQRPVARGRARYQWLYEYAFLDPRSGRTLWLLLPSVSIPLFTRALSEFAAAMGAGPDHWVVLVVDRAGWHTSAQVEVPEGLVLVYLPPYSPELQPAERLWELADAPLANRVVADLDELETLAAERCRQLHEHPEWVRGRTAYAWWPTPTTLQRPVA
jgi:DDE superfamily endonuclease